MELSATLIVKNELENLQILLPSIEKFSDEIIIVDTGSVDGTVEFLKKHSFVNLFHAKWENNFSQVRNIAIEHSGKDFIIWFDADDRIDSKNIDKINIFKKNLHKNKIYFFKLINGVNKTFSYQLRLFPNHKNIRFIYPVHEQLNFEINKFKISYEDIEIVHEGYNDRNILLKKQLRNIEILENYKEKDFYTFVQLAESYKILKNYEKAVEFFFKSLKDKNINNNKELSGFIYFELYKIFIILQDISRAEDILLQSINYADFFPVIYYYIGKLNYDKGLFEKAKDYFIKFLEIHKNKKYINPVPLKLENSALYFLANSFKNLEMKDDAKNIAQILLTREPDNKNYLRLYEICQ